MPMPIANLDEYDKVVNVSWFTPEKPREELRYGFTSEKTPTTLTSLASPPYYRFPRCIPCVASISGISSISSTFSRTTISSIQM